MMIKKPKEPNIHIFFFHSLLFSLGKQNKLSHENGIETEGIFVSTKRNELTVNISSIGINDTQKA